MEHIRSAIEKARQQRLNGRPELPQVPRNPLGGPEQMRTYDAHLEEVWNAIPNFDIKPKRLEQNRIVAYESSEAATPFDVMRTNLLHKLRGKNWNRVAITSPGSKCGKTTMALNLAFSLARQHDIRTMVIELDLRRPSIAQLLDLNLEHSIADVLSGKVLAAEQLVRHGNNLAIAACNKPARNAAELLQGVAAAQIVDEIEARYQPEVMIFDMPPMLLNDDTIAFIDQIDCALLIGAAESTTINEIGQCQNDLATRTNVLGVVLNKCRYLETGEGYRHGVY